MLEVRDMHVHYGGIHAVKGISLSVPQGAIITLVGANGAGKSTTLRALLGLVRPSSGQVTFMEQNVTNWPTHRLIREGLAMVPEGRRVFANLSVRENLVLGAYSRRDETDIRRDMDWILSLFPRLGERITQRAGLLSGGEQQMLAVGRALMSRPRLLMMDEPSLGLAPMLAEEIFRIIKQINSEGKTVLLIEQNARKALELSDYAYVLETGAISAQGEGRVLLDDDMVRRAYLGEGAITI